MHDDVLVKVVAMCDGKMREVLGYPVQRCIHMHLPPARLNLEVAAWDKLKRAISHKYRVQSSHKKDYESTFYDEANSIVVTVQPVWYCFNSRRRLTGLEFSMKVVAYVQREELVACTCTRKRKRLQFDLRGKVVRGVNYVYKTGQTVYEDVLPEVKKIDFCVGE